MALAMLLIATSPCAAALLYQTGFEPPTFVPGILVGRDDWSQFAGISVDAATVCRTASERGTQSVAMDYQLDIFLPNTISGGISRT